jgi:hypothetical protein
MPFTASRHLAQAFDGRGTGQFTAHALEITAKEGT